MKGFYSSSILSSDYRQRDRSHLVEPARAPSSPGRERGSRRLPDGRLLNPLAPSGSSGIKEAEKSFAAFALTPRTHSGGSAAPADFPSILHKRSRDPFLSAVLPRHTHSDARMRELQWETDQREATQEGTGRASEVLTVLSALDAAKGEKDTEVRARDRKPIVLERALAETERDLREARAALQQEKNLSASLTVELQKTREESVAERRKEAASGWTSHFGGGGEQGQQGRGGGMARAKGGQREEDKGSESQLGVQGQQLMEERSCRQALEASLQASQAALARSESLVRRLSKAPSRGPPLEQGEGEGGAVDVTAAGGDSTEVLLEERVALERRLREMETEVEQLRGAALQAAAKAAVGGGGAGVGTSFSSNGVPMGKGGVAAPAEGSSSTVREVSRLQSRVEELVERERALHTRLKALTEALQAKEELYLEAAGAVEKWKKEAARSRAECAVLRAKENPELIQHRTAIEVEALESKTRGLEVRSLLEAFCERHRDRMRVQFIPKLDEGAGEREFWYGGMSVRISAVQDGKLIVHFGEKAGRALPIEDFLERFEEAEHARGADRNELSLLAVRTERERAEHTLPSFLKANPAPPPVQHQPREKRDKDDRGGGGVVRGVPALPREDEQQIAQPRKSSGSQRVADLLREYHRGDTLDPPVPVLAAPPPMAAAPLTLPSYSAYAQPTDATHMGPPLYASNSPGMLYTSPQPPTVNPTTLPFAPPAASAPFRSLTGLGGSHTVEAYPYATTQGQAHIHMNPQAASVPVPSIASMQPSTYTHPIAPATLITEGNPPYPGAAPSALDATGRSTVTVGPAGGPLFAYGQPAMQQVASADPSGVGGLQWASYINSNWGATP
uniref:Uncharacterized protein n=1 Tax=Chromera velia CCMP2878 TaxID=1169474 RepID=A0A0G4HRB1_9ALVE|eukprot:Cvel_8055.t1-p1 / transcript=Cvel_8055.t1 / gene=Cvel_8055 / organism=Chromera_velia_CCMP2878 / gene_product=hypothetical protein / transcript_product=hypothetical protein / location=Cvel_scaffold436:2615-7648(+) / protein_length=851 / sequence_SO=supercontig / SO=protein_coding / is_pseudo=false